MSVDPEQLIQLFDAKVQAFESAQGERFHALLPFKDGILRLRAKKASCRTITELLNQLGVIVSHTTISRFCRELAGAPSGKDTRRVTAKTVETAVPKPQPSAIAQLLSQRHQRHESGKPYIPRRRERGPRIADPKNV